MFRNRERDWHGRVMPLSPKRCDKCGETFRPPVSAQRFCSRECAGTARSDGPTIGVTYLDEDYDWAAVERLIARVPVRSTPAERYRACVALLERGMSNAQVAQRIGITQRTVERYRARWRTLDQMAEAC